LIHKLILKRMNCLQDLQRPCSAHPTTILCTSNNLHLHLQQPCSAPPTTLLCTSNNHALHLQQPCSTPPTTMLCTSNNHSLHLQQPFSAPFHNHACLHSCFATCQRLLICAYCPCVHFATLLLLMWLHTALFTVTMFMSHTMSAMHFDACCTH